MKKILIFLTFLLSVNVYSQSEFNGTLTIIKSTSIGSDSFNVRGIFNHSTLEYLSTDCQVGDFIYWLDGSTLREHEIYDINSNSGGIIDVDLTGTALSPPVGKVAISRKTGPNNAIVIPDGLPSSLETALHLKNSIILGSIGGIDSITTSNDSMFLWVNNTSYFTGYGVLDEGNITGLVNPFGGSNILAAIIDSINANLITSIDIGSYEIDSVTQIISNTYPAGSRIVSKGLDGKGEAIYFSYSSIPSDYPVQTADSRFIFQDASSNYIVYQPDSKNRYNAKALGLNPDWSPTTITGTDNKTAFLDIVEKLDSGGYHIFIPEGTYGWTQATGIQEVADQGFSNLTIEGSGEKTKFYFLDGSRPFEIFNSKSVVFKNFYATTYNATGETSKLDLVRAFNIDSLIMEGIVVDSMNLLQTQRGKSNTIYWSSGSTDIVVRECSVNEASNSIILAYTTNAKIHDNYFNNSSGDHLKFNKVTNHVSVYGNLFKSAGDDNLDAYGGGSNIDIRDNIFDEGQLEIKAHAKANTGNNVNILWNKFLNEASINIDDATYAPLREDLRYSLSSDGTVTHNLNLPTTDNTYLEIYAFEQGSLGSVTFTTSSITADGFDFTLTSGSYPVTVILQHIRPSYIATYRDTITLFSGTTTHTITSVPSTAEADFGEPSIIAYDPTTYSVIDDGVDYSYSTWGDTLTLNWSTALPADRFYIVQVGLDGMKGLHIEKNFFQNGFIVANGSIGMEIKDNEFEMTTDKSAISLPYPLNLIRVTNNRITYLDSLDLSSSNPAIIGNSQSVIEGIQEEKSTYIIEGNIVRNASRFSSLNNLNLFKGANLISKNNVSYNQEDAVSLSGIIVDNSIPNDTIYAATNGTRREYSSNSIFYNKVWYADESIGRPAVITTWVKNSDNSLYYTPTVGDLTDQDNWLKFDTEFQGILDDNDFSAIRFNSGLRTTGGSTNRNWKWFNNVGYISVSQSLDLRGTYDLFYNNGAISSQDVSIAKYNGLVTRVGAVSGTGSIDTIVGNVVRIYNGSGHSLTKSIAYDIEDQTVDPIDSIIGLRIPDLSGGLYARAILQKGIQDTSEFKGHILLRDGTNPVSGGSEILEAVVDTLWEYSYRSASTTVQNDDILTWPSNFDDYAVWYVESEVTSGSSSDNDIVLETPNLVALGQTIIIHNDDTDTALGSEDNDTAISSSGTIKMNGLTISGYVMATGETVVIKNVLQDGAYMWEIVSSSIKPINQYTITTSSPTIYLERDGVYVFDAATQGATTNTLNTGDLEIGDVIYVNVNEAHDDNTATLDLSSGSFIYNGGTVATIVIQDQYRAFKGIWDGTNIQWIGLEANRELVELAVVTSATTATPSTVLPVNTTAGAVTITPPTSPIDGVTRFAVYDSHGQAATNNITIATTSQKINTLSQDVVINATGDIVTLIYVNSTIGWRIEK